MMIKVGKRYLSNGVGILKCIAECNGVFIVENDDCCYYVDSKGIALYLNSSGGYEEYKDRTDLDLVCEVVSAEEDYSSDVAEVLNKYLESENGKAFMKSLTGPSTTKNSYYFLVNKEWK